jgi:prepilin-type processing-associated H-X9-DG protein
VGDTDGDGKSNVATAASMIVRALICPTDEQASDPILGGRRAGNPGSVNKNGNNPPKAQGLWYPGSMGPTIPTDCRYGPPQTLPIAEYKEKYNIVCGGSDFGSLTPLTDPAPDCPKEDSASAYWKKNVCNRKNCLGLICRRHIGIKLKTVTDGLANTFLAGETLPAHWNRNCIVCDNYPVSSTHIPLNTMERRPNETNPDPNAEYWKTSGFKSMHPGGANMLMGDGSVHFVSETIDWYAWNMLGSAFGGDGSTSSLDE